MEEGEGVNNQNYVIHSFLSQSPVGGRVSAENRTMTYSKVFKGIPYSENMIVRVIRFIMRFEMRD